MTTLTALMVATAVLVSIPGPNAALIVATSLRYGLRSGFAAVLGTTMGVALQLLAVAVATATIIDLAAAALVWVKWIGVVYLVALGVRTLRAPAARLDTEGCEPPVLLKGCMIACMNPKTLLFNAAFLPQFVAADAGPGQIALVAAVFLSVLFAGDMLWALFAAMANKAFRRPSTSRNRLAGGFLIAAGAALAMSRSRTA